MGILQNQLALQITPMRMCDKVQLEPTFNKTGFMMFHCSSRGGNGYLSACTTNTCNQLTARCGEPHEVCGIHDQKVSKAFTWI